MRIVLADDQSEVRSALRLIIEQLVGYAVVAEAADGPALLNACDRERPDVVLLDWELPGVSVTAVRALLPDVRVVAMSARPSARTEAAEAGADAFVSKGEPPRLLIDALDALWR